MNMRRLGRGLGGLLQSTVVSEPTPEEVRSAGTIPVAEVRPNPYQPRRTFDEAALQDLKASIQAHGVLQPIVVRRAQTGFELVAGERRLRACKALGLSDIPAIIRDVDESGMQTLALVENLQREDLNALEKAKALKAMMATQGLTHDQVAERVGKDRATITNLVRLLELPDEVKAWIEEGRLSAGQAKAVLQAGTDAKRTQLAKWAVDRALSVREVERLARLTSGGGARKAKPVDPFVADIEERLRRALSAKVRLKRRGGGGTIEIDYHDATALDAILDRLGAT
jgi:ParB family chromosome partitioning protein